MIMVFGGLYACLHNKDHFKISPWIKWISKWPYSIIIIKGSRREEGFTVLMSYVSCPEGDTNEDCAVDKGGRKEAFLNEPPFVL